MARAPAKHASPARAIAGQARLARRTKELVERLAPGDIAVIAHRDLDRVSGEDLVAAGVATVVNCLPSSTGAYPNAGPLVLTGAGIPVAECLDADLFELLADGDAIELRGATLLRAGRPVAAVRVLDPRELAERHETMREDVGIALEAFARTTVERLVDERELLSGQLATLAALASITLYGELRSLSAAIEKVPPLRALDWLGRKDRHA